MLSLLLIGVLAVATYGAGCVARRAGIVRQIAQAAALILVVLEMFKLWLAVSVFDQPWTESLPLHLCRLSSLLCAAMLAFGSYRLFEVAYFWVMGGSVAALLTPDLAHGFPHLLYFTFFIGHGLVVFSVLFAVAGYGFRPRLQSIVFAAAVTAVYMLLMVIVNALLDANYLYLRAKPPGPSIYDYLGPWPWYVVWAAFLLIGAFAATGSSRWCRFSIATSA